MKVSALTLIVKLRISPTVAFSSFQENSSFVLFGLKGNDGPADALPNNALIIFRQNPVSPVELLCVVAVF